MKILGLCGSLRESSSNAALMCLAKKLYPHCDWDSLNLADLPYFEPEFQYSEDTPSCVNEMRSLAAAADLIFIFTPEYAHGIPGVLKNALEWLFSDLTSGKPVAVVIGSAQGEYARDQLLEVLQTMDFAIDESRLLLVKGARAKLDSNGQFVDKAAEQSFSEFCNRVIRKSI